MSRDRTNLDIFCLKDESLKETENLPLPALLAAEFVEILEAALDEFRAAVEALAPNQDDRRNVEPETLQNRQADPERPKSVLQ